MDLLLTDPPYPDHLAAKFNYDPDLIKIFGNERGFIFWSNRAAFPVQYSARHVWDKRRSCKSEYEFIYEINGRNANKLFSRGAIDSIVAAQMCGDSYFNHPTQKPIKLIEDLINYWGAPETILDPFMGSGTTLVACAKLGRKGIGIEIDPDYFEIACKRVRDAYAQPDMFIEPPKQEIKQEALEL